MRGRQSEDLPPLAAVSFSVAQGEFRWLLGPSGAGKSSLLRLLHLESLPASGQFELLGTDVVSGTKRSVLARLRQRIGMVHQDFRLMPTLSVADNVALPLRLQKQPEDAVASEVDAILNWVGLTARRDARPAELSGGEQQRTAVARAVITRPALILADEPTNALEDSQAIRVISMLREISAMGATVIVATHNDALVHRFPAPALRLEHGRLKSDE
ncbi:cell division ATP-binding protein FtsE [Acetobacter oeni]|uniref:Cell division ATP-binding protein FtsE n=2 Tax=Acetobacter oeni TaxID=304077 RepID=A0A511XGH7_9PROT|nr:cell division ATP-binding protein FtsE [Acetobacter oeni]